MPDYEQRSHLTELIDDLPGDSEEVQRMFTELAFINRALGGYRPSLDGLAELLPAGATTLSLLDVGTGPGDFARRLHPLMMPIRTRPF